MGDCILRVTRKTRKWPLLNVETEVNEYIWKESFLGLKMRQMGTQGVHLKGVFPWLITWARCACTGDFYPALAALVSPVQNIFFIAVHYFTSFVPKVQQAGQAVVLGRLSINKISLGVAMILLMWLQKPPTI
jgi:hypothetical protein